MRIFCECVCVCIACVTQPPILELTHLCPPMANLCERKKTFYNLPHYQQKDCQVHGHCGINDWV